MDDAHVGQSVRAHVLGWRAHSHALVGFKRGQVQEFRVIDVRCLPMKTRTKLENTLKKVSAKPATGDGFDVADFVPGTYTHHACASDARAVQLAGFMQANEAKPFFGRVVNESMRDVLVGRLFWTAKSNWTQTASGTGVKSSIVSHLRATDDGAFEQARAVVSARVTDLQGWCDKSITPAELREWMDKCELLPYAPPVASFTSKNNTLDALQCWLHDHSLDERGRSERDGFELTLLSRGLQMPSIGQRSSRARPTAQFMPCNGQLEVKKWSKIKSCRCGLSGPAWDRCRKKMRSTQCGQPAIAKNKKTRRQKRALKGVVVN